MDRNTASSKKTETGSKKQKASPAKEKEEEEQSTIQNKTFTVEREIKVKIQETKLTEYGYCYAYGQVFNTAKDWKEIICPLERVELLKARLAKQKGALMFQIEFSFDNVPGLKEKENPGEFTFKFFYSAKDQAIAVYDPDRVTAPVYLPKTDERQRPSLQKMLDFIGKFPVVVMPSAEEYETDKLPEALKYVPDNEDESPPSYTESVSVAHPDLITKEQVENLYWVFADFYYENLHRGDNEDPLEVFPALTAMVYDSVGYPEEEEEEEK
jgi:hypothetical protein